MVPTGRRSAPRVRLDLPARLTLVSGIHECRLESLSIGGARISSAASLHVGRNGLLKVHGIDAFFHVEWVKGARCGLRFDDPIPDELLMSVRMRSDNFRDIRAIETREMAREWIEGGLDRSLQP